MDKDIFDEKYWSEKIKDPLWYKDAVLLMKKMLELANKDKITYEINREKAYSFFEDKLYTGEVALGHMGKDFDKERKDVDTVVIHHTHGDRPMSKERLSAMTLLRLYTTSFANPSYEDDKDLIDKPVYSGHFRNGKQVFYPYHWIVRQDGSTEQLLFDNETGWHAGDWDINCRSVAIALDADYENSKPSDSELESIARLIKEKYSQVKKERIFGHREVNSKTTCPSNLFLSSGTNIGWKESLLSLCYNTQI